LEIQEINDGTIPNLKKKECLTIKRLGSNIGKEKNDSIYI
jgi:hypothetical protein